MTTPPSPAPLRSNLPRKTILLFLLTSAAAFGIIFLFRAGQVMGYLTMIFLVAAFLGLTAGFGARVILKHRHGALRLLAAFAALTIGLVVVGLFTNWKYGLRPLNVHASHFDWAVLIQLTIGGIAILLSMYAWHKSIKVIPSEQELPRRLKHRAELDPKKSSGGVTKARRKPSKPSKGKPVAHTRMRKTSEAQSKKVPGKSSLSISRRRQHRPEVQFVSSEEHRCPYCLELVQPKDPRGVVECKICHTLHHADCWAITGVCQVPHLNT
jgi:hypothetical protein